VTASTNAFHENKEVELAFKDRLNDIAFTCSNRRFETDISKGHPHGNGQVIGSVFPQPVFGGIGYTLWLEYVTDKLDGHHVFWLMWYDTNGSPTIPLSGVFDASDIQGIASRLATFIQVP
jgi:hypothetical protein